MEARAAPDVELAANLSEVIGLIYDCALDPARWPHALAAVSTFIGGNRVRVFVFNVDAAQPGDVAASASTTPSCVTLRAVAVEHLTDADSQRLE